MNCAIPSQLCHLNLFVEKRRKNRGLRLFSAEGNKRGIIFRFDDGRTQIAFINSKTETFAGEEVREVWSVGLRGKGQLSAAVANGLLAKNHQYKVGNWETVQQAGEVLAIFRVSLSADANQSELISVLQMVATQADEVEKEFLGNDDL